MSACEHERVTEEEKAEMIEALKRAARADKRADQAKERTTSDLRNLILQASRMGFKPFEIRDAIDRHYSDGHLSRVIHGKA